MYVGTLTLMNIRSYQNIELKLSQAINLLVGNNNSGKSTLIKALYKLQNSHALGIEDIRKSHQYGRIYIDMEDISIEDLEVFERMQKENPDKLQDIKRIKVAFGIYTSLMESRKSQESVFFDLDSPFEIDETGKIVSHYEYQLPPKFMQFDNLPNQETHNNFIYPFFAKRKTTYYSGQAGAKDAFHVGEDLRNITSKIQKISNPSHPQYQQFIRHVRNILGFDIGVIPHGDSQSNTGIYVGSNTVIPIESMGEGVVNILGLIVMLLSDNRKLYLIEELENDIHPKALKKLLELILEKSATNQFVISTHSNIVVKYLGIETSKIFYLQWQPFETKPEDKLPTTTLSELKDEPGAKMQLLEELGYDVFDFDLYKSYLIFEESSAEALIRDFLIPVFCPSLKDKIKTIAASGVDDLEPRFHDFLRLFVFVHQNPIYNSRAWVIADGDDAGRRNIEKLKASFPGWSAEHFIALSKNNIEEYYPKTFQKQFNAINKITDKQKKRAAKKALTVSVLEWIKQNPENASLQFAASAPELIQHLKIIESKM